MGAMANAMRDMAEAMREATTLLSKINDNIEEADSESGTEAALVKGFEDLSREVNLIRYEVAKGN